MMDAQISAIVIGRNEGQRLKRCLESIQKSFSAQPELLGGLQLIYVDSASSDRSPELAAGLGAEVVILEDARPTAALGRNAGLQLARGPFLLFLDGDTILDHSFPRRAMDALRKDESIAAVWGHRREIHPERTLYNRILDLDWVYPPGEAEFCGGDVLMRRSALLEVNGYDPALIAGEEPELCRRMRALGYRILHIDCPMTGHDLAMTSMRQYWRRATRAGYAYAEVSSRFRSSSDPFWAAESRGNLLRGGLLLSAGMAAVLLAWPAPWLSLGLGLLFLLLVLRSSWRSRWKAPGKIGLLLWYGLHSHLQQIPIFFGQMRFFLDRKKGHKRGLIEYKEESSV